ncbi:alpha/beta fold hydrolase [Sporosarcina limicola]|uniref:Pimeloyl-ACP methyl ester carboxylesterase n=1 Tax=Sporosarcina limicola TaxID=34101 RepID=A0A927MGH6_9BACL|nr:alpha/beta hydrolase [Sporosarcina limicola]MBE1554165.1 pimeloyl-ACP methyl ester carboxylesterase [Sporosarcina limicola]
MSINYKIVGEGFPIVILHGWSLDHQVMLNCLEPVFEKQSVWKRIYIDLPGMGGSKPLETIQNSDDMLNVVLGFIDQIIPDEPFLVCGNSYGGYLARGIAHFRRNLARGMFLIAPMIVADYDERCLPDQQILKEDQALLSRLSPEDVAEFEPMAVIQGEREWKRFHEEILIPSRSADVKFMDHIRQNGYGFTFDVDAEFLPFEHPALIITGRQDNTVGFKDAWKLIDNYPRATFAALDMAGHNLQIEQSDVFEALMNNWLNRAESVSLMEQ